MKAVSSTMAVRHVPSAPGTGYGASGYADWYTDSGSPVQPVDNTAPRDTAPRDTAPPYTAPREPNGSRRTPGAHARRAFRAELRQVRGSSTPPAWMATGRPMLHRLVRNRRQALMALGGSAVALAGVSTTMAAFLRAK